MTRSLLDAVRARGLKGQRTKHHELISRMRVQGGNDCIEHVHEILGEDPPEEV